MFTLLYFAYFELWWYVLSVQGCEHVDLIPGGSEIAVNASNVHDYVRKYAEYRMVKAVSKPLEVDMWFQIFCHYFELLFCFLLLIAK